MISPRLPRCGTWPAWRAAARRLAGAGVPPEAVDWGIEGAPEGLFAQPLPEGPEAQLRVPRAFAGLAPQLVASRDPRGMNLAYRLLLRLQRERGLLADPADPETAAARAIAKEIRRDIHKMRAFVRFRELPAEGPRRRFAAWFEPAHRIEELNASFFTGRFGDMDWVIETPEVTMLFAGGDLSVTAASNTAPRMTDGMEDLWRTYYANIFNPARLKVKAMCAEMPRKYWKNLPEAQLIPELVAGAAARVQKMGADAAPAPTIERPAAATLPDLARQAAACTRCPLHREACQTVFGEGPADASVALVGEQPGDAEDRAGRPFVGPAGQLLDQAMAGAGLPREEVYLTNAVKHFKYIRKGVRRIHQRPGAGEVQHCRWWLQQELQLIQPRLTVALGATALSALTGDGRGLMQRRGRIEETPLGPVLPTLHPARLLRLPDPAQRAEETAQFQADLALAARYLQGAAA